MWPEYPQKMWPGIWYYTYLYFSILKISHWYKAQRNNPGWNSEIGDVPWIWLYSKTSVITFWLARIPQIMVIILDMLDSNGHPVKIKPGVISRGIAAHVVLPWFFPTYHSWHPLIYKSPLLWGFSPIKGGEIPPLFGPALSGTPCRTPSSR